MAWLAGIAAGVRTISGQGFLITFAAVIGGTLLTSGVCLAWLTRWASNKEARRGQFGVASLFFLVTLVAIYLATVRFVSDSLRVHLASRAPIAGVQFDLYWLVVPVALVCLVVAMISVPIVMRLLEALMWFAVWLVRHPQTRHWMKKLRANDLNQKHR
ncbi:MAG TPA: hypothetical protein VJ783_28015 [Pirellulales bacterium]|nr:hypothetical protein [Pirellulales bacterium]